MVYEIGGEIVIVDAGLAFPRDEHLGVDLILPDFGYLKEHDGQIRALLLTHAHEDHVGALPYLMRAVRIPEIWGTKLTLGLIQSKLDEHGLLNVAELKEIDPDRRARADRALPRRVRAHGALGSGLRGDHARERGRPDPAHGRLQARPHAGRRPPHRRREARRARKPRHRPPARGLDERGAARASPARSGSSARLSATSSRSARGAS